MNNPALVSLTFDDGLRCQFERAVPILDQQGFPATFFLVANTDPIHTDGCQHPDWPKVNWSEQDAQRLRVMVERGHEIGSHSVTHRQPNLRNDAKGEAENSRAWIQDRLGVEVLSYCYPFCYIEPAVKSAVIGAGYRQARWCPGEHYYSAENVDFFQVNSRFSGDNQGTRRVGDQSIGTYGAEDVGAWVRPGCWHVVTFHGIGNLQDGWFPIPTEEFVRQMSELAKRRDAGDVEVVTFKDGADRLRSGVA
jgi:hypothetical protein